MFIGRCRNERVLNLRYGRRLFKTTESHTCPHSCSQTRGQLCLQHPRRWSPFLGGRGSTFRARCPLCFRIPRGALLEGSISYPRQIGRGHGRRCRRPKPREVLKGPPTGSTSSIRPQDSRESGTPRPKTGHPMALPFPSKMQALYFLLL